MNTFSLHIIIIGIRYMVTCIYAQSQRDQDSVPFYSPLKDLLNELFNRLSALS